MADVLSALQLGVHYHRSGRLYDAEKLYREVLGSDPECRRASLVGHDRAGRGRDATGHRQHSDRDRIQSGRGRVSRAPGRRIHGRGPKAQALACYRQAVHLQPLGHGAQRVGQRARDAGNLVEAEACYRTAIQLDPKLAEAHNNLGNALQDMNRLVEAASAFQERCGCVRSRPRSFLTWATATGPKSDSSKRPPNIEKRLPWPDFPLAHHNLGTVLQSEKQFEAAIQSHGEALRLKPVYLEALNALAQPGNRKEISKRPNPIIAARNWTRSEPTAKYNLATALQCEGRYDEAESLYKAVIDSVGRHRGSLMGLSIVCLCRGDIAAACDLCNQGCRIIPMIRKLAFP